MCDGGRTNDYPAPGRTQALTGAQHGKQNIMNDDIMNALGVTDPTPSTELATKAAGGTLAGFAGMEKAMRARAAETGAGRGGKQFARFDHGQWFAGKDRRPIGPDERFLLDVTAATHGWIALAADGAEERGNGGVLFTLAVSMTEEVPPQEELPAFAPGTEVKRNFGFTFTPAADPTASLVFETSTRGGAEAWGTLVQAVATKWQVAPGALPVVTFASSSYLNRQGKRVHKPIYKIVEWQLPG